mgnify:CR=1 FL=1
MSKSLKYNFILILIYFSFGLSIDNHQEINRPFKQAGSIEALIASDIDYDELILVQLDMSTDSLLLIINNNIPELDLNIGLGSYHRIFPIEIFNRLENLISPTDYKILKRNYSRPNESRQYWVDIKQGGETLGTYTEDDAISYTCDCVDGASDCVKLGWYSWYNPFDYWGEAWWGFTPPVHSYVNEIRVTIRGAQCDLLPTSSETYMGMQDNNGNWSQDYQLSIDYADNIFVVPEIWNSDMLVPRVGSEDNYVVDQVTIQFFYTCLSPDTPDYVVSSDGNYCDYINLSWEEPTDNDDIIAYNIYRDGNLVTQVDINTFNFQDYGASQDVIHEYCITSLNDCGESEHSCNTGYLKQDPIPVDFVDASDGSFEEYVYISWSPSENASLYKIYRDETWLGIIDSSTLTEYIDYYIDYEFEHEYCIEVINDCGISDWMCDIGYGAAGLGDINNDTAVDILDVVLLVNIILDYSDPTESQIWASDINNDNQINIQDIILLVSMILD